MGRLITWVAASRRVRASGAPRPERGEERTAAEPRLIRANQLRTVRISRRRLVTPSALAQCIELLGDEAA
jgi:hypothetical protein